METFVTYYKKRFLFIFELLEAAAGHHCHILREYVYNIYDTYNQLDWKTMALMVFQERIEPDHRVACSNIRNTWCIF